jgi:hypothetical protein
MSVRGVTEKVLRIAVAVRAASFRDGPAASCVMLRSALRLDDETFRSPD